MSFDLLLWMDLRRGALLASNCTNEYNKILELGRIELEANLHNAEQYDHDNKKGNYADKNAYFNRTNSLGLSLLRQNATGFSKMYYWHMLNIINQYEHNQKKPLNKGMVCANLGVSSLSEGDIDGGIAYLAWTMQEDRLWLAGNPSNSAFESDLYKQFAEGTSRGGNSQFGGAAPWIMLRTAVERYNATCPDKADLTMLFKELENAPEHRALFEGAVWAIHRNLRFLREETERGI